MNECSTIIAATQESAGRTPAQIVQNLDAAVEQCKRNTRQQFGTKGER